ncbi:MAG: DUF4129 domain-containing protein [Desulfobacteraceae bacterium]|nr:DUF4129 domain-containing protein [Desulfobacteraceae bacterium]
MNRAYHTHKRLLSACCVMDLCWLCAWANFLTLATAKIRFPLATSCAAFFMALFLSFYFRSKGYRRVWNLMGYTFGLVFMIWGAVFKSVAGNFSDIQTPLQWYQAFLVTALVGLFWYKGIKLSHRSMAHRTISNHFDLGISLLFALLLVKLLIYIKTSILLEESFTLYMMGVYFIFGLIAVFLSQNSFTPKTDYLKGFHLYGLMISLLILLLFCSMGVIFILLPFLTSFAESGYVALKHTTGPLSPYLIAFLKFVFSSRNRADDPTRFLKERIQTNSDAGYQDLNDRVALYFSYGATAIIFLLGVFVIGYVGYIIFKYLNKKQLPESSDQEEFWFFSGLMRWILFLFNSIKAVILAFSSKVDNAHKGFARLVAWGRKSGVPKRQNETPAEYAQRLCHHFMPLENEIRTIVSAVHIEAYGEKTLTPGMCSQMAVAVKTIHSPVFWLMRFKSYFKKL